MLALAKDITQSSHAHPEEASLPRLKEYMDYQRKLRHDLVIYHSLDHAKTDLRKNMDECGDGQDKLAGYLRRAFPFSHDTTGADTLLLMLRKLINAQNSTNNWYRLNQFYFAALYDCVERFVKIYNKLVKEQPAKAREYNLSDGVEIDFDDWVSLYFHNLDFMLGKKPAYLHYVFTRRNEAIEEAVVANMKGGKSKKEALEAIKGDFDIDPDTIKIVLGERMEHKDQELFYTSAENPIYENLYDPNSASNVMDDEAPIDRSYFLAHILKGMSRQEADSIVNDLEKTIKK
ncbi:MAG: hypothetical protein HY579_08625 [Nitrospinae bacterium]|nr:hypothetical protein [Nitrospinota bacterium]